MIATLALPPALREQLAREARAAFPRECCGLIEGVTSPLIPSLPVRPSFCEGGQRSLAAALHPTPNLAREPDRFEIDHAAHFALLRSLRGADRGIIGCYHSHPNGRAEPSLRDIEGAGETGFLWLIAALESADAEARIACFAWTGSGFAPVAVETD